MYNGREKTDFTIAVDEVVPLSVSFEPTDADVEIIWTSSNQRVFRVVPVNDTGGRRVRVTGVGTGTATLTVSVGGVEAVCTVFGKAR